MIIAVTGMPGAGKTFFLVCRAKDAMKKGRHVFSNFPIKGAYQIKVQDLVTYTFPPGSLILIDEAGRDFSAHDWKLLPPEIFDLFTLHRHIQLDMIVAMNAFGYIDIALRRVVELTYWASNRPYLPYFTYKGYYDLERTSMNREHDVSTLYSKFNKARKYYDTHAMSAVFKNREMIPKIKYSPKPVKKIALLKRYIRMKFKVQKFKKWLRNVFGIRDKVQDD